MTWADAVPNFLIGLREGLEAGIVVSILVAAVHRTRTPEGEAHSSAAIWIGVAGAVAVAGSFAAVLTFSTSVLSSRAQEAIGGFLSVTAVALVTAMVFWMRRAAKTLSSELREQVGVALTVGAGALALTAFLAVGREGLETTLFLWTAVEASGETVSPLIGAALGIVASVTLCWLLYRKAIQLNLSKFFNTTALALLVIAAGVLAYGIGSLQAAELLPGSSWIAFDLTNQVSATSWWATIFTGLTALRFQMSVLQVVAWVGYLGITVPAFVLAGRESPAPVAPPVADAPREGLPERFTWLAKRPWAVGGATVVVPILLAAGAIVALPSASATTATEVTVTATTCADGWHAASTGSQSFTVHNASSKVAEVTLVTPSGAIVAEIETLGPSTTATMPATLGADTYRFRCILPGQAVVESDAVTVSGSGRVAVPAVAPVTAADLEPAVDRYRAYVAPKLATLSGQVDQLQRDLDAGDPAQAKRRWLDAQLTWERIGAAYGSFGDLGDAIDGLPQGLREGVDDPDFTGLHRIEHGLWHGQTAAELAPAAAQLTTDVHELRSKLDEVTVDPTDLPVRAQEILEDALRDHLSAMSDFGSGSSYALTLANVDGTRAVLEALAPLIDARSPELLATVNPRLDALEQALLATRDRGAWRGVADTPLAKRQHVTAAIGESLETLANIPTLLEVPPQR